MVIEGLKDRRIDDVEMQFIASLGHTAAEARWLSVAEDRTLNTLQL
jgi:hypothetical protein